MKKKKAKRSQAGSMFWAIVREFLKAKGREIWEEFGDVWIIIWAGGGFIGIMGLSIMLLGSVEYLAFHRALWWAKIMQGTPGMWHQIFLAGISTVLSVALLGIAGIVTWEIFKWLRDNWVDATAKVKSEP